MLFLNKFDIFERKIQKVTSALLYLLRDEYNTLIHTYE
jgi:hypothetical protein